MQRLPNYVDIADAPEAPIYADIGQGDFSSQLVPVNEKFGRGFQLVSFRWLDPDEIPDL